MLELKNISKYYNAGTVNEMCLFNDFNLSIDDGEFVSVVGSNGSGKTSMLNLICGSIPVDAGKIIMHGTDITNMSEYRRHESQKCRSTSASAASAASTSTRRWEPVRI